MTAEHPAVQETHEFIPGIVRKILAVIAGILLAITVLVSGVAITLNIHPLDVSPYLHYLKPYLKVGENTVDIQEAIISYKGSLRVDLAGISLKTPEHAVLSNIDEAQLAFSNRNLVLGRIIIKHAYVSGMNLQLGVTPEGFEFASLKIGKREEGGAKADIVSLLNNDHIPALKYLKTVEIVDSSVQLNEGIYGDIWSITHIEGMLEQSRSRGMHIELDTVIQRVGEEETMPAILSFSHFPGSESADMYLQVADTNADILAKYLPPRIQNLLSGEGTVRVGTNLIEGKGISNPYFQIDMQKGAFIIDGIYGFPLPFDTLHIKGTYSRKDAQRLDIDAFDVKDDKGYILNGRGSISNILEDPYLDLSLGSPSMPLRHLLRYLPDQRIGHATSWINSNVYQAVGTDIRLVYTGAISEFPCKRKEAPCGGFDGSFDYTDLNLRFVDEITPATDLKGHFIIRDGEIVIQASEGKVSNQSVSDITVSISDLFNNDKTRVITVLGKAEGEIQGVLDRISEKIGAGWFPGTISGTHVSDVKVTIPLKDHLDFKDIDFNVKSSLSQAAYDVPVGKYILPFTAEKGDLTLSEHRLAIKANGELSGVPVAAVWKENLLAAGEETTIALNGQLPEAKLNGLARDIVPIESIGNTPFSLLLSKLEKDTYDYELEANLKDTSLIVPLMNWEKVNNSPFEIKARGQADINGKLFAVDNVTVTGEGVEIAGGLYLDDKGKTTLTLSPFKLGNTNITAVMSGNKIVFEGPSLDISGFDILEEKPEKNEKETPRDIEFDAHFDLLTMSGGPMNNVDITADREGGLWQNFVFSGLTKTGSTVEVNLGKETMGKRVMRAKATNAGEALRTLGLYDNLNEGLLTLTHYMDKGDGSQADGELRITRTKIKDLPILARLLSLLSLEQLLSGGKGIIFDDIVFPYTMTEDKITISKAVLEGPSIGMRFSGDVLTSDNQLNIKGSLIPVQGLNKVVSNLPIVGNILTGSQDGLLVADFKIKGSFEEPDIKTNPLSAVTPGVLKDIFGAFSGDDKK